MSENGTLKTHCWLENLLNELIEITRVVRQITGDFMCWDLAHFGGGHFEFTVAMFGWINSLLIQLPFLLDI